MENLEEAELQLLLQSSRSLPVGCGFRPTDVELVNYYLKGKNSGSLRPLDKFMIPQVDVYKFDPWDLSVKSSFETGDPMRHFFARKDPIYPGGRRYNRTTQSGHWKVTGEEREIRESAGTPVIGKKRTLIFYKRGARGSGGTRTIWTIHEYTTTNDQIVEYQYYRDHSPLVQDQSYGPLPGPSGNSPPKWLSIITARGDKVSLLLEDGYVLCRLHEKPEATLLTTRRKSKGVVNEGGSRGSSHVINSTSGGSPHANLDMLPGGLRPQSLDGIMDLSIADHPATGAAKEQPEETLLVHGDVNEGESSHLPPNRQEIGDSTQKLADYTDFPSSIFGDTSTDEPPFQQDACFGDDYFFQEPGRLGPDDIIFLERYIYTKQD